MSSKTGSVHVLCVAGSTCSPPFCVTLIDSCGNTVGRQKADCSGHAEFPIDCEDYYRIRVQTCCGFTPRAQNRWIHLSPEENVSVAFNFIKLRWRREEPDTLNVT